MSLHRFAASIALFTLFAAFSLPAFAQLEDYKTRQLAQDVAELQRTVRQQQTRIDQLEREIARVTSRSPRGASGAEKPASPAIDEANQLWLSPKSWDRVQNGMTEAQVLEVLGYPTSARVGDNSGVKTLFYTLQVGSSGFLSGQVELENNRVRVIQKPTLR